VPVIGLVVDIPIMHCADMILSENSNIIVIFIAPLIPNIEINASGINEHQIFLVG